MNRRQLLQTAALGALACLTPLRQAAAAPSAGSVSRVRPGDAGWPSEAQWAQLGRAVGGRLSALTSALDVCRPGGDEDACRALFKSLKNPYAIGDDPRLSQTTGWIDAWSYTPSAWSVAARDAADVAAAINFAREHNLRLTVRGGAHSYLGTSTAPDSLQVWTRAINAIVMHDAFVGTGCEGRAAPQPAVSVGAGAIWMQVYNAVTTKGGRIVQGGGCGTVGVAGLIQGGGFGTYSKAFGTAGCNLLEAEVVTADGQVRVVNACQDADLFWALKGGGGGTFGVVTRVTLRTHPLPEFVGVVSTKLQAKSEAAYRALLHRFVSFYADNLHSPHWGEVATLKRGNLLDVGLEFQGLAENEVRALWRPFLDWATSASDITMTDPLIVAGPARRRWDAELFRAKFPSAIQQDERLGAPPENVFWTANLPEAGHFIHGFESVWLPAALLRGAARDRLVDALFAASRNWSVELHFQKGLAGAVPETLAATRDTPINPAVLDAFALAIIAGEEQPAFVGLAGHEPKYAEARRNARAIKAATAALTAVVGEPAAYVAESGYFQERWQEAYWGANYARLAAIKQHYDPDGLLFARHGVGSEAWSEDGFTRRAAP
ncbi:MAG: FAD-dependent oxidoreductase [Alphaproteobacteria bacterium]|nr:FAD-dependent oxidoreductase [Alphaproteobacteria bacterium]